MEKLPWFKFTPKDWLLGKIQRVDEVTQARFVRLMCLYWKKGCELSFEDAEIEIEEEHLLLLLKKKVIKKTGENIVIEFLDAQCKTLKTVSAKNSENARKRWDKPKTEDATGIRPHSDGNADIRSKNKDYIDSLGNINIPLSNDVTVPEKSTEDEKHKIDWDKLLAKFNSITGKKSKVVTKKARSQFLARLKDGFSKEDIISAITNCFKDEHHVNSNHKWLTLEFISRAEKMEMYSQVKLTKKKTERRDSKL